MISTCYVNDGMDSVIYTNSVRYIQHNDRINIE